MLIPKPFFKTLCLFSVWIAVFHLAGQGFAPGAVLCLQADGRVSVEVPGAGNSCADLPAPHQHQAQPFSLAVALPEECCGPCADLALPDESVSACPAGRLFAAGQPPFLAWQNPAPAILQHPRLSTSILHPPPSRSLPPAHLRHSTVLLI